MKIQIDPGRSGLLTDLYQLTMLQAYSVHGMEETAVFEFFVRKMPEHRGFLMAAGLEQVLDYLSTLQFTPEEIKWLHSTGRFNNKFLEVLAQMRFTGDVHAMPEGTVFFPDEPILRITAPIMQAQLVESRLINLLHFQTLIASKAARCVLAAPGKLLVDFGLRRAHGAEAGLLAARASYLAGFRGSSTVAAGALYGIRIFGTMAHSFVQAHDDELVAFDHFASGNPGNVILLIDTYDTEAAAKKVVELAPQLRSRNIIVKGVRIDSGDLAEHARRVRRILDAGNLKEVTIFASGNLDEYALHNYNLTKVPIDGYGVGTHMDTSSDAPFLDCAYKLQEYAGIARRKRSEGKATWPGRKQVYRRYDSYGTMMGDTVTLEGNICPGDPLIQQVMRGGKRVGSPPTLDAIRVHAMAEIARIPAAQRELNPTATYPVTISEKLLELAARVDQYKHSQTANRSATEA